MTANKERLFKDVAFLTGIRPYRNYQNNASLNIAANYIKGEFDKTGLHTEEQKWTVNGKSYKNIIATINAEKEERLILGAHYDVHGDQPGADDNASGIAGLLETCRLIAANGKLPYRIDFVAYALEEPPFFGTQNMGSFIHARALSEIKTRVLGMICFEMIGYFSDEPLLTGEYPIDPEIEIPENGNFIAVVGTKKHKDFITKFQTLMSENPNMDSIAVSLSATDPMALLSDHRNYIHFGFPALMINDTSFLRNPHYHLASDTIDTLNFDMMAEVVNSVYHAAISIEKEIL
jgi:Zn-dependent M28 family amino/carboxypeptidase